MRHGTSMKVPVRDLPSHQSIELGAGFVRDAIDHLALRKALEAPADDPDAGAATAEVDLYAESDNVHGRGRIEGWLTVACGRCVGPVKVAFSEDLAVTFMTQQAIGDTEDLEEEIELTADDLDVVPYDGETIDLEPILREHMILAVPFAPLCKEECAGLCPQCGIDRNVESCECQPPIDPRLAALQDIKLS